MIPSHKASLQAGQTKVNFRNRGEQSLALADESGCLWVACKLGLKELVASVDGGDFRHHHVNDWQNWGWTRTLLSALSVWSSNTKRPENIWRQEFFYLESEGKTSSWQLHLSDGFLTTGDIWWFQSTLANCKTRVSWLHVFQATKRIYSDVQLLMKHLQEWDGPALDGNIGQPCGPLIAKLGIIWRVFFESLNPKSSNIH